MARGRLPVADLDFAEGDEFGVAEDAGGGDFGEFDFGFDFRTQPCVVGYFVGGDSVTPVATWQSRSRRRTLTPGPSPVGRARGTGGAATRVGREVGEGAVVDGEGLQEFEQCAAVGGVEALVDFADEEEFGLFELADQEELKAFAVEAVGANDEVLRWLEGEFEPVVAAAVGLVFGVEPLGDDAFESVGFYGVNDLCECAWQ